MSGNGGVRVGDAERERASNELGDHFAAGRLTRDEFDDRLGQAWNAKTVADLSALFVDLPNGAVAARPQPQHAAVGQVRRSGPRLHFPPPVLLFLAIALTIITHVPFLAFFLAWFVMTRVVGGSHRRHQLISR